MKTIRLIRELKLKNLEAYKVKEDFYGETICYMLIADFKRPSTLADFLSLKGIEDENDFGRSNFIKVICVHSSDIDNETQSEIVNIAGGFLENKDDCHWNAEFEKIDCYEFSSVFENKSDMLKCFERILAKFNLNFSLSNIHEDRFNYLSQD